MPTFPAVEDWCHLVALNGEYGPAGQEDFPVGEHEHCVGGKVGGGIQRCKLAVNHLWGGGGKREETRHIDWEETTNGKHSCDGAP